MVTGNENVKIVYHAYPRHKWIDLRQTKIKMINGPFYTYPEYISPQVLHKCFVFVIITDNL